MIESPVSNGNIFSIKSTTYGRFHEKRAILGILGRKKIKLKNNLNILKLFLLNVYMPCNEFPKVDNTKFENFSCFMYQQYFEYMYGHA